MYVRAHLETFSLSPEDGKKADLCHAVIPLDLPGSDQFAEEFCIPPADWLAANPEDDGE